MQKVVFFTILMASSISFSQNKVNYVVSAEAHALMCPFLSPKLMDLLTKKGAEGMIKDDQLQLHFFTQKDKELSDEAILNLVDAIGYEPKNFKIIRTYE
jgi:hypothetical protein